MTTPAETAERPANRIDTPAMALRTYACLRIGAIGVIAVLTAALIKEYRHAGNCLQGSISAYYYTPVRSVFVGALVTLGLVMIVLWGKTAFEDGTLNLAGLVAPVVAFVPTSDTNRCDLASSAGQPATTPAQQAAIVKASHDAIFNNMLAYIIIVGLILALLFLVGVFAGALGWSLVTDNPKAFWIPWAVALVLWGFGTLRFASGHHQWFYDNAHEWAARTLFAFIILAVIDIGFQHLRDNPAIGETRAVHWVAYYWGLAAVMVFGGLAVYGLATANFWFLDKAHRTFVVEAWMIFWLAIFWIMQTVDRWTDGAPRTDSERNALRVA